MDRTTAQDVSESHVIDNPAQARALELLDLPSTGRVRLSLETWRRVDRIAAAVEGARNGLSGLRSDSDRPTHVPTPRGAPGANQGVK